MSTNVLWHNSSTNETQLWFMDRHKVARRATAVGESGSPALVGAPWLIVGTGDFNSDGEDDLLWHDSVSNETKIWFMDGQKVNGQATVRGEDGAAPHVGPPWSIVGAGDFNDDGKADILWHNSQTNEIQLWFMAGYRVTGRATVVGEDGRPALVGPPWSIVGTGDFSADGKADILWHNGSTGETQVWFMDGNRVTGRATVLGEDGRAIFVGPPWSIVGTGDFSADGGADILWHNSATGETQVWFMDGNRVTGRATVLGEDGRAIFVGLPWSIVGAFESLPDRSALSPGQDSCFEDAHNQKHWRFCSKCNGLAFNRYSDKGRCPAGGAHQAAGYMFGTSRTMCPKPPSVRPRGGSA